MGADNEAGGHQASHNAGLTGVVSDVGLRSGGWNALDLDASCASPIVHEDDVVRHHDALVNGLSMCSVHPAVHLSSVHEDVLGGRLPRGRCEGLQFSEAPLLAEPFYTADAAPALTLLLRPYRDVGRIPACAGRATTLARPLRCRSVAAGVVAVWRGLHAVQLVFREIHELTVRVAELDAAAADTYSVLVVVGIGPRHDARRSIC
mmetsp:Transcript_44663/g.123808  ORF Transcript_44663/g.123808 Transcript_44663/m.123808 type:complete len:205 (-) Transcript_44663:141-755(-)